MATITAISDHSEPGLKYNPELMIATGKSRFETHWKNKRMLWSELVARLQKSVETPETHAEYMQMSKDEQDRIKDIGGFVGGHLKDGHRKTGNVVARQILTLDMDFAPTDLVDQILNTIDPDLDCAMAIYSTHKHTEKKPRLRLIMPLDRPVSADEYEAIARKIAEKVGIDYFDDTTYQATRLMYWPSHSAGIVPYTWHLDRPVLKADDVLAEYPDWSDASYWPESSRMTGIRKKEADKQGDPTEKKGVVGAFCRTYTVQEAIAKFLPDVYTETAMPDRYTYAAGSTAAGLVIYEGGKFAYSNHATDPCGGQLCNAFDLVRIHKYGDLDEGHEKASGKKRPSYKAMCELAVDDPETKLTLVSDKRADAMDDFAEELEEDPLKWRLKLSINEDGSIKPTASNAVIILENDPVLKNIKYNELSGYVEVIGDLPWDRPNKFWRNADDAQLYTWVAAQYHVEFPFTKFTASFSSVVDRRRFNPLRDYIDGLPEWDGVERIDTLLIDYLGASDNRYTREVTRRTLIGAIKRVYEPGCKFDYVLVLDGKPGIGKSTLLQTLGGEFFSDSLSLSDTRDKTAAEKLQGIWIMEIGEMQGTRKADIEAMKSFISCQVDKYRPAYGRVVEQHPRTAILCGTTNSMTGFLRDTTGNRRFWPVEVSGGEKSIWDMTLETRDQIWAEALSLYQCGEVAYLDPEMEAQARIEQLNALEYDEREGGLEEYLNTLLPADWYSRTPEDRVDYFQGRDALSADEPATLRRDVICSMEIWREYFGKSKRDFSRMDSWDLANLMARIPGWERSDRQSVPGYGQQRPFRRKTT